MNHHLSKALLTFSLVSSFTKYSLAQVEEPEQGSEEAAVQESDESPGDEDTSGDSESSDQDSSDDEQADAEQTDAEQTDAEQTDAEQTDGGPAGEAVVAGGGAAVAGSATAPSESSPENSPPAPSAVPLDESAPATPPSAELESLQDYEPARIPTPFDQGRIRLGLGIGWASSSDDNWTILGLGVGYFVVNGLELGLDSTFWVGGDPFISTLTPGLRYVFHMVPTVKPYVGAFYRHYFVGNGWDDSNGIGGRAGIYFMVSRSAYIGGGIVYEHLLDDNLFADSNQVGPEITFAFAF